MEEIINYLQLKNQFLDKFYSTTKKFLESTEDGKWNDMSFFVDNRERILNIIRYFDYKISLLFKEPSIATMDVSQYQDQVKALLDEREAIAKKIVEIDLVLISTIDEMKSETITELKKNISQKQKLESFSTSTNPPELRKPVKTA